MVFILDEERQNYRSRSSEASGGIIARGHEETCSEAIAFVQKRG